MTHLRSGTVYYWKLYFDSEMLVFIHLCLIIIRITATNLITAKGLLSLTTAASIR